jgi:hypothetical protein
MADAISDMIASSGMANYFKLDFGLLIIIGFLIVGTLVGMYILNGKYPRREFIVSVDGSHMFETRTFRLDADKIVSDNILEILFSKDTSIGEDIKDFRRIILNGKWFFIAALIKKTLLPIWVAPTGAFTYKLKGTDTEGKEVTQEIQINLPIHIVPSEIVTGRRLGERYVEMQKKRQMIAEANRTMMMNIMVVAPVALILLATIIGAYIANKALTDVMQGTIESLKPVTFALQDIVHNLPNKTGTGINMPKHYVANSTG